MFFLFQYVSDERVMSIFFRFNSTIFNWLSANCLHEYKRKMGFVRRIHVIDSRTYVKSKELLRVSGKALVFVNYARANLGPGNSQIIWSFAFDHCSTSSPTEKLCLKPGVWCQNKNDDWFLQELKNSVARTTFHRLKKNKKIHLHFPMLLAGRKCCFNLLYYK